MKKQAPSPQPKNYPEVEKLIDTEDFTEVNEVFSRSYAELAEIAQKKGGFRKSRDAKKIMTALELSMDLFRELLQIKYSLPELSKTPTKSK